MAESDVQFREPAVFAAGDTLSFARQLREFSPSDGWHLHYEVLAKTGDVAAQFDSAPEGDAHKIYIQNFGANFDPKLEYILAGFVVNADNSERHKIYSGDLIITPNFGAGAPVDDQTSFEEKMIAKLQASLLKLAEINVAETDVQRVRIVWQQQEKTRAELAFWEERNHYRKKQQARANGRPDPNRVSSVFRIAC